MRRRPPLRYRLRTFVRRSAAVVAIVCAIWPQSHAAHPHNDAHAVRGCVAARRVANNR